MQYRLTAVLTAQRSLFSHCRFVQQSTALVDFLAVSSQQQCKWMLRGVTGSYPPNVACWPPLSTRPDSRRWPQCSCSTDVHLRDRIATIETIATAVCRLLDCYRRRIPTRRCGLSCTPRVTRPNRVKSAAACSTTASQRFPTILTNKSDRIEQNYHLISIVIW